MCTQRRAGRRQRASPAVCTLPIVPCGSSPVTRVSRSPPPYEKRSPWGGAGAEVRPAIVSGIVFRDVRASYCSFPVPSNNPRGLCKTQLVLETVNPFEIKFNNELTIVTFFSCTSSLFQSCTKQHQNDSKNRNGHTGNNPILHNSWCTCDLNKRDRVTIRNIAFTANGKREI